MLDEFKLKYSMAFNEYFNDTYVSKKEVESLIKLLVLLEKQALLTNENIVDLLKKYNYDVIYCNVLELIEISLLTMDTLDLLLKSDRIEITMDFIEKVHHSDLSNTILFKNTFVINTIEDLSFLIECSSLGYHSAHQSIILILAEILSNPLSKAILAHRFYEQGSFYSLDDNHIQSLTITSDLNTRIKLFFDYSATFRNQPMSQKRRSVMEEEGNIERLVQECFEDNSQCTFEDIKFVVAADVVSFNHFSTLTFDELMSEINTELSRLIIDSTAPSINPITPEKRSLVYPLSSSPIYRNIKQRLSNGYEADTDDSDNDDEISRALDF